MSNQAAQHWDVRDILVTLETHVRGMWRYRWRVVIVMWIVCAGGWVGVYLMPNEYEANARIYVDTENVIKPLLQGIAVSSDVMSEVSIVTRELLSRPNLTAVARETDMALRATTNAEMESLLTSLQRRVRIDGGRDNVFSIAFQDHNRGMALSVVESLVDNFVEQSLGADRSESSQAQKFLQQQITEYEARLTEAEDRLAEFKRQNVAYMPDQQGDYFSRLQAAQGAFQVTQSELQLAQDKRAELLRQLEGEVPVLGLMPMELDGADGGGFASAKIRELEAQLEELRLQYTDRHPRIGQILDTIEVLKEQQAEEQRQQMMRESYSAAPTGPNSLDINPVYQNMRIQLSNTEVEIAALRTLYTQQQDEVRRLTRLVDTIPQVEAELNRLNRDYDVVKAKYEQLVRQLETANIGEDVEKSMDDVQFRVIDPPFAQLRPVGPNRPMFLSAVLLGAIALGSGLAFLLNLLHPVFFAGRTLTEITGLPVLGSVTLVRSADEQRRRRRSHWLLASAAGALILAFALATVLSDTGSTALRNAVVGI